MIFNTFSQKIYQKKSILFYMSFFFTMLYILVQKIINFSFLAKKTQTNTSEVSIKFQEYSRMSIQILRYYLLLFLIHRMLSYRLAIPNYEMLLNEKVFTKNDDNNFYQLNKKLHINTNLFDRFQEGAQNNQVSVLNNASISQKQSSSNSNDSKIGRAKFSFFCYPYRAFSYIDRNNNKQFILEKIQFQEFKPSQQKTVRNQSNIKESLTKVSLNIKQQMFAKYNQNTQETPNLQTQQKDQSQYSQPKQQSLKNQTFSQFQLYQLLPPHITFQTQPHQIIQLSKLRQNFIIIKNTIKDQNNKYTSQLELFRMNVHSFIYDARYSLLKYLFQTRSAEMEQQKFNSQTENLLDEKFDNIKMFEIRIGNYVTEKWLRQDFLMREPFLLESLIFPQASYQLNELVRYDYSSSKLSFYLVTVQNNACPYSTNNPRFQLNSNIRASTDNNQKQRCSLIRIYIKRFQQWQTPDPIEFINKQDYFLNINYVRINYFDDMGILTIDLIGKEYSISLEYGKDWRNMISWQINKTVLNTIFLNNTRVIVYNESAEIYHRSGNQWVLKEEKVINLSPFVLTSHKINSKHFVICVQGSRCTVYDNEGNEKNHLQFDNAIGLEWSYKVDYIGNSFISYGQINKRGDNIHKKFQLQVDPQYMNSLVLKPFQFHKSFQIQKIDKYQYKISRKIIDFNIQGSYLQSLNWKISPQPLQKTQVLVYNAPPLFKNRVYRDFFTFKKKYLDNMLTEYLEEIFKKIYFPEFSQPVQLIINNSKKSIEFPDISTEQGYRRLFEQDCYLNLTEQKIHFKYDWNMCRVAFGTNSLLVIQPIKQKSYKELSKEHVTISGEQKIQNNIKENQKSESSKKSNQKERLLEADHQKLIQQSGGSQKSTKLSVQMFMETDASFYHNYMVVCAIHKNSRASSKCRVNHYQITEDFYEGKRKVKFFLEASRYFQVYFFRQKFLTADDQLSFLETLQKLSNQYNQTQQTKQINKTTTFYYKNKEDQLKNQIQHYGIYLLDYEKRQMQLISHVLIIGYWIVFPPLFLFCLLFCLKNYIHQILAYYGFVEPPSRPVFDYPLSNFALKFKIKELKKNKLIKIYKNKRQNTLKQFELQESQTGFESSGDQNITDGQFYDTQCCFCLEKIEKNQKIVEVYCQHEFHSDCFLEWIKNEPNTKCPLCKRHFTHLAMKEYFKSKKNNKKGLNSNSSEENQNDDRIQIV